MTMRKSIFAAAPLALALMLDPAAGFAKSAEQQRAQATAQLPTCGRPIGTMAVSEPENHWWGGLGLGSPEALIRVYVQRSGCFRLVNRSQRGMEAMERERNLAGSGELRRGGTIGKGQMVEADFTVIPDIVTSNNNRSGGGVGGLFGHFIPGAGGAILGGLSVKSKSADVVLNVVNNKSSEEFVSEGQSKKTDVGWGAGLGVFSGGWLGAGGAYGYDNTEIGQVIALAYLDAYSKLVQNLGGMQQAIGGQQAERAVSMKRAGPLRASASTSGRVLKTLTPGSMLYPTGNKAGGFWEVEDELGAKGWVAEASLEVAR
jgi:curli biogenesis system outer membrane secretion channel CsgG